MDTRTYGAGRTEQVQFRVTKKERDKLRTEAASRGFSSLSDFARYVCLQAVPDLESAQAELQEVAELESQVLALANTIRARHGKLGGRKPT